MERALDACLEVRQQLRVMAFRGGEQSAYAHGVCIGLDSGELVSGNLGSRALGRLDFTVLGDVVNTAARLASVAAREQLLIGEHLRQRVEARFECLPAGERRLPGASAVLPVHDVVGRRDGGRSSAEAPASTGPREVRSPPQLAVLAARGGE